MIQYRETFIDENSFWWAGKPGCFGNLGPNKMGLKHKPQIDAHPVNLAIKSVNKFISNAFKIKGNIILIMF